MLQRAKNYLLPIHLPFKHWNYKVLMDIVFKPRASAFRDYGWTYVYKPVSTENRNTYHAYISDQPYVELQY